MGKQEEEMKQIVYKLTDSGGRGGGGRGSGRGKGGGVGGGSGENQFA